MSQRKEVLREHIKVLYRKLSESMGKTPEAFHFSDFEIREGKLYCRDKSMPLTIKCDKLRKFGVIAEILGKEGLHDLGFDILRGKVTAQQAVMLT